MLVLGQVVHFPTKLQCYALAISMSGSSLHVKRTRVRHEPHPKVLCSQSEASYSYSAFSAHHLTVHACPKKHRCEWNKRLTFHSWQSKSTSKGFSWSIREKSFGFSHASCAVQLLTLAGVPCVTETSFTSAFIDSYWRPQEFAFLYEVFTVR